MEENKDAIAMYEKLGFKKYGTLPNNMKYTDESYMDAYWMMKKPMKVVLIRHGKVNFKWRLWYTSEQFNEACRQYNMAPIQQIEYSIPEMVIM